MKISICNLKLQSSRKENPKKLFLGKYWYFECIIVLFSKKECKNCLKKEWFEQKQEANANNQIIISKWRANRIL